MFWGKRDSANEPPPDEPPPEAWAQVIDEGEPDKDGWRPKTLLIGKNKTITIKTKEEWDAYKRLERVAYVMDEAFRVPGTDWRFGLDPLLGLIPFVGDLTGYFIGLAFIAQVAPVQSRWTTTRMLYNLTLDSCIGAIPIFGDCYDFFRKANVRNKRLYEKHMEQGSEKRGKHDRNVLIATICCVTFTVILIITAIAVGIILLLVWAFGGL
eukprot:Clim_evm83s25 gene=Clim_evmTU83s25